LRSEGKIKAVYALCRYLRRIPALAALIWMQNVIQTSDGKIKAVYALCRYLRRIPALAALIWMQNVIQTSDGKVKGTKVRFS
jgi:hypothetical protein